MLLRDNKVDVAQARSRRMRKALNNHPLAVICRLTSTSGNNKADEAYEGVQQVLRAAPDYMPGAPAGRDAATAAPGFRPGPGKPSEE